MTAYGDTNAWVQLTSTTPHSLGLFCEEWSYDMTDKVIMIDYPNRGHFGFTLNTEKVTVKLKNVYVTSETEWNDVKAGLIALTNDTWIKLKIKTNSTGPTYEKWDGVNTVMPVVINNIRGKSKKYRGDAEYYVIGMITLVQSDALEA